MAVLAVGLFGGAGSASTGSVASPPPSDQSLAAVADTYSTTNVGTLAVGQHEGVLANDSGGQLQIISHTDPVNGALTLQPDGSFGYVPQAGFTGDDTFTYTIANAVHLYSTDLPPLGTFGGVSLTAGAYGSSLYPDPGKPGLFYGLEDRGPNVAAPDGNDVEPIATYDPAIALFQFDGSTATLLKTIPLLDSSGHPYSGLVNTLNPTGEKIEALNGHVLAQDPDGYDSEGLVAMHDGTFWVSDEYGPFLTHFDASGRAISRLSPLDGTLPRELAFRVPNRGMEGLTVTPNGRMLVGIMQSALQQPDLPAGTNAKSIVPIRIVTYDLQTHALHEYLFLLDNPKADGTAVSELTALTDTTFLVDERDGNFPATGGYKKLWKIDLAGATDVGPASSVPGATYNGAGGGLLVGGKTIEDTVSSSADFTTSTAAGVLTAEHITPVEATQFPVLDALLGSLDSQYRFFSHDKVEGVAALDGGNEIVISNDSDFGISGVTNTAAPWQLQPKLSPATGKQDDGEYLVIDMTRLPAQTSTATVTIHVSAGGAPVASTTSTASSTTSNSVPPGTAVTDTATVSGTAGTPTGSVSFFLCQPATVTANGGNCSAGGTQVGSAIALAAGSATSSATTTTTAPGTYCWRAEYGGDSAYNPSSDGGTANECFTVVTGGGGPIGFAGSGSYSVYGSADSRQVTVPAGSDRVLVFVFAGKFGGDTLSSVTYGGQPLTLLSARDQHSAHVEVRYLSDPPTGTAALAWSKTGASQNITWGWTVYTGVDQATPFGAAAQSGATDDGGGSKSVTVAAAAGDLVVDAIAMNGAVVVTGGPAAAVGQSQRWSQDISTSQGGSSDKPGAPSVTMSWTPAAGSGDDLDWAQIAAPLRAG